MTPLDATCTLPAGVGGKRGRAGPGKASTEHPVESVPFPFVVMSLSAGTTNKATHGPRTACCVHLGLPQIHACVRGPWRKVPVPARLAHPSRH